MIEKGIEEAIESKCSFNFTGTITEKLKIRTALALSEEGMKVDELRFICDNVTKLGFIGNIRS
jgi:hypothetical protein